MLIEIDCDTFDPDRIAADLSDAARDAAGQDSRKRIEHLMKLRTAIGRETDRIIVKETPFDE